MMHAAVPLLLEAALRALAAACLLGLGLRLLRVRNVPAQKAAWGLVLVAALAMPLLMRWPRLPAWAEVKLPVPAWPSGLDIAPAAEAPVHNDSFARSDAGPAAVGAGRFPAPVISVGQFDAPPDTSSGDTSQVITPPAAAGDPLASAAASAPRVSVPRADRIARGIFALGWLLYLGVASALLCRLFFGLGSSLRVWTEARPAEVAPDCEWPSGIPVRWSRQVASPVNIGSGILLPADYAQWDGEKLRVVLAHERSHVHQRDFYLQLLAGLYAALTWFSPLGWWLKRKLSELGEAISDRAGLEAAASPSAYAQLLLEFAARPRTALTGVAMAQSNRISQRIERLLNDESFRQAFAGRRSAFLAVAVAPLALIAASALVRVQAAEVVAHPIAAQAAEQAANQAQAVTGQSHPDDAQVTNRDSSQTPPPTTQPDPAPAPAAAPYATPAPPAPPAPAAPDSDSAPAALPAPPMPQAPGAPPAAVAPVPPTPPAAAYDHHYSYRYDDGDAYAIVGDPGTHVRYSGEWDDDHKAEIDKARSVAHGHFLWFRHDGKSYIVDDPAIVSQIEAMDKPMEDLGAQMRETGKQMREAGQQAREEAREEARKAREASRNITVPDLSKEMADLNAAMATLQAKVGTTVTREQLAEIERKLGEVQRKLMNVQIKVDVNWSGDMGQFSRQQGEFGAKMGQMGAEMGRMARENNEKIRSIIDESLKNGKARPVE